MENKPDSEPLEPIEEMFDPKIESQVKRLEQVIEVKRKANLTREEQETLSKGGRPTVLETPGMVEDYIRIYQLSSVGCYTAKQIVDYFWQKDQRVISRSLVSKACKWCRDEWPVLSQREYLVDAENVFKTRIREYTGIIETAKLGEPVFKLSGEPLLDKDGKQAMKVEKERVDRLMRDRTMLEKGLMELRGQLQNNQTIINNTAILGDAHVEMVKKLTLFEIMDEEDRSKYLEIFDKYGKIEPEEPTS